MRNITEILNDPKVYRMNRVDAHSDHLFYETYDDMRSDNQTLYHTLNGTWQFYWSKNLSERPIDFYKDNYDLSDFNEIQVPAHIELSGYDKIQYVNTQYPWDGLTNLRPPFVDSDYNPVGSYVTFFDLKDTFISKDVFVSFKGVQTAFCIFLNGTFIGYSEDSFTPSDFDLTQYIRETNNKLCVEVYKNSSASWLEDQDYFRFSGIFRDVILYAKPKFHIEDLHVLPRVHDDLTSADFSFRVKCNAVPNIKWQLLDENATTIASSDGKLNFISETKVENAENDITYYETSIFPISSVNLWNINLPYLYTLEIMVYDDDNELVEVIKQDVGFRHFVIRDAIMYLNGERLIINGVNRHEWNPKSGRVITADDMITDIKIYKKNNISATRTSHYPNHSLWYELCDKAGIIVMDEANLESHGSWQKMGAVEPSWNIPASLDEWRNATVDRAVSMYERDKNHPSILWWSCGNESYAGECILAMANYFRRKDDSRYVHYEGCFYTPDFSDITDVYSRMYPYPSEIEEYLVHNSDKPYLLCEYMHNMGNSLGGMESYIELLDKYERYQGGFIWDFIDQALYQTINGREVLSYGGDFCDRPSDYNFSGNGIVCADRSEKPAMQEVRFWYSNKDVRQKHIDHNASKLKSLKPERHTPANGKLTVVYGDVNIGVSGDNFNALFSLAEGGIVSLVSNDYEWLYRATRPTYWRALTENDSANGFAQRSCSWNMAELYSKHTDISYKEDDNTFSITYIFDTLNNSQTHITYTVFGDGTIKVTLKLGANNNLAELATFGMKFMLNDKLTHYDYTGYSGETYPDRYKGGTFDNHSSTTWTTDYLVPQENSCHVYNYRADIINQHDERLSIIMSDSPFHFSLLDNTAQELENAMHKYELPQTNRSILSILSHMRGVGGINTWGADVEEPYRIKTTEDLLCEFYIKVQ